MDMYADLAEKPHVQATTIPPEPKRRGPIGLSGVPLEKDVQAEIIAGLLSHPLVGLVERVNSGSALEQNRDGSSRYIAFNVVYQPHGTPCDETMVAVDISCTLKVSGQRFVIEVKRPGWKHPRDKRERGQAAYIQHIISLGGFGLFATSWEQVRARLSEIEASHAEA